MFKQVMYVLHSPYSNSCWRGIEKCVSIGNGAVAFFESREMAEAALASDEVLQMFYVVEPITVEMLDVGEQLTAARISHD